jgi:hypothetical protein
MGDDGVRHGEHDDAAAERIPTAPVLGSPGGSPATWNWDPPDGVDDA